jgi:hypothetical protein
MARSSLLLVDGRNGERRSASNVKEFLGRGHAGEVLSRRQQVGERWRGEKFREEGKMEANRRIGARWRAPWNEDL